MADDLDGIPRATYESDPMRALWKKIDGLQERIFTLERAAPARSMSLTGADGSKITFDPEAIQGFNGLQELMFRLASADGTALFKGPVVIEGTLSLPAGIINNEALSSPLQPGSAGLTQSNFALATSPGVRAQASITVPPGYTQALVMNGVSAGAANTTASHDFLYVAASINGTGGGETATTVYTGTLGSASAWAIRTLTGLNGGNITVETRVRSGNAAWPANGANFANTNALVLFLR